MQAVISDVEILHAEGVVLDELAPRFDLVAHENRKDEVGLNGVVQPDLKHYAGIRVEGGLPELARVHLSKALVPLDLRAFSPPGIDVVPQRVGVFDLGLRLALVSALPDEIRRWTDRPNILFDRVQLLVLRGIDQVPIDYGRSRRGARTGRKANPRRAVLGLPIDVDAERHDVRFLVLDAGANQRDRRVDLRAISQLGPTELRRVQGLANHESVTASIQFGERAAKHTQAFRQAKQRVARKSRPSAGTDRKPFDPVLEKEPVERALIFEVDVFLAAPRPEKRRLRDVQVTALDELRHLPVEERQQK